MSIKIWKVVFDGVIWSEALSALVVLKRRRGIVCDMTFLCGGAAYVIALSMVWLRDCKRTRANWRTNEFLRVINFENLKWYMIHNFFVDNSVETAYTAVCATLWKTGVRFPSISFLSAIYWLRAQPHCWSALNFSWVFPLPSPQPLLRWVLQHSLNMIVGL